MISCNSDMVPFNSESLIKFKSLAINGCVSISYADPKVICKNLEKSLFEFLEEPSAIFEGIDTDARRNWLVSPNFSASGNFEVMEYISEQNNLLRFQISNSLNLCIKHVV